MNNQKIDLVILCGGKGTRLGNITKKTPKPLIKINGIPFLQYLIDFYQKYHLDNIYLICYYKASQFKKKYHLKYFNSAKCHCIVENQAKDTAGALFEIKNKVKNNFLLVNGDSYLNYNFMKFIKKKNNNLCNMILVENKNYKSNKKLSSLSIDSKKNICFSSKSNFMNSGIYFFRKKFLKMITNEKKSLENDILPVLIKKKMVSGFKVKGSTIDIGLKKNLNYAKKNFKKIFKI
jgi:NDP-sugar pyrophosphorylase family protein